MRAASVVHAALVLAALGGQRLAAQVPVDVVVPGNSGGPSIHDLAAWSAMMATPYGSLPPVVTRTMAGRSAAAPAHSAFELRYGRFAFDGSNEAVHTGGVGMRFGAVGAVIGYQGCSGCDGSIMGGVDYEGVVVQQMLTGNGARSLFIIGLRPAVGFARSRRRSNDASAISANIDLPVSVSVPVGATARMVPFVSPGFGVGAVRGGGTSESGTRGAIAFGAALVDLAPGLGLDIGWRKVFLEHAPMTIGVSLSFDR
jgi:hypothetical protein